MFKSHRANMTRLKEKDKTVAMNLSRAVREFKWTRKKSETTMTASVLREDPNA